MRTRLASYIHSPLALTLLALLLLASAAVGAEPPSAPSHRPSSPPETRSATVVQAAPLSGIEHRIDLAPLPGAAVRDLRKRNARSRRAIIGIARDVTEGQARITLAELNWQELAGGERVATVRLTSPEARALRAAIDPSDLPPSVRLHFHGSGATAEHAPPYPAKTLMQRARTNPQGLYWSPIIDRDTLLLELRTNTAGDTRGGSLRIARVSHLMASGARGFEPRALEDIGAAGNCHSDVACTQDPAWNTAADSTAKYIWTSTDGDSFLCSGTLLNDSQSSGTPWFLTANHCLNTQAAADTVVTYWGFERSQCAGPLPDSVTTRDNGGELVATGVTTDYTLLRLHDKPPADALYAGWNTAMPLLGDEVRGIHHPQGDLKKISHGTVLGFTELESSLSTAAAPYIEVRWMFSGATAVGSSGSALFNDEQQVVGQLYGGASACLGTESNLLEDVYGRFDQTHGCIAAVIGGDPIADCPESDPLLDEPDEPDEPERDEIIDLNSGEAVSGQVEADGWSDYRIEVPQGSTTLQIKLDGLSADGDLYVRRGERPDLETFDCRSITGGTADETCTIDDPAADTWYIGVHGFEATAYTLTTAIEDAAAEHDSADLPELTPAQPVSGSVRGQRWVEYRLEVPAEATSASFAVTGLTGQVDLFARHNASPEFNAFDCRSITEEGRKHGCAITDPELERWQIGLYGFSASAYTLTAHVATDPAGRNAEAVDVDSSRNGSVSAGAWSDYRFEVPAQAEQLTVELSGLSADGDLYLRRDGRPDLNTYDCRPWRPGNDTERCIIDEPAAGTWYAAVHGFQASDYRLRIDAATPEASGESGNGNSESANDSSSGDSSSAGGPLLLLLLGGALLTRRIVGSV